MRTFLDSGVLLSAWDARRQDSDAALALIEDERREFLTCDMVRLELLPKPACFKNKDEVEFYETIFSNAVASQPLNQELFLSAFELAKKHGLAAVDALNIAAALKLGAEEFITTELPGKPMFRVHKIKVITLCAAASN